MEKKEVIIKTALKLFVNQGFENTPTSQISKESNVATGTLFHHFKTKEELINAAYVYVKKSMASCIFSELTDSMKTMDKVKSIWINLVKWSYTCHDEALFLEKFYGSSYIDNLTVEQMQADFETGSLVFADAVKEGLIKEISPDLFSGITFGLLHAFSKELALGKKLDSNLVDLSFDVYWGALKK